jgi:hypothetical protein
VVLAALVLPRQSAILEGAENAGVQQGGREAALPEGVLQEGTLREAAVDRAATVRLAMFTGIFNLLWATVTVLMIIRPGSTTGA